MLIEFAVDGITDAIQGFFPDYATWIVEPVEPGAEIKSDQ